MKIKYVCNHNYMICELYPNKVLKDKNSWASANIPGIEMSTGAIRDQWGLPLEKIDLSFIGKTPQTSNPTREESHKDSHEGLRHTWIFNITEFVSHARMLVIQPKSTALPLFSRANWGSG